MLFLRLLTLFIIQFFIVDVGAASLVGGHIGAEVINERKNVRTV